MFFGDFWVILGVMRLADVEVTLGILVVFGEVAK